MKKRILKLILIIILVIFEIIIIKTTKTGIIQFKKREALLINPQEFNSIPTEKTGENETVGKAINLYNVEVGNKTDAEMDNIWESNNSNNSIVKYIEDGDTTNTKQYRCWVNTRNYLTNNGVLGNLVITLDNLNIETSGYKDIRLNLDYLTRMYHQNLINKNCFRMYVYDENGIKYGPYEIEETEFNGFYENYSINYKNGVKRYTEQLENEQYGRGYNVITENLLKNNDLNNKKIVKIEIIPFENFPLEEEKSNGWRNMLFNAYYVEIASIKIDGYANNYENIEVEMEEFDTDKARYNIVQRMYDQATIKWEPSRIFNYYIAGKVYEENSNVLYYPGSTYYGTPYTQGDRGAVEYFYSKLDTEDNNTLYLKSGEDLKRNKKTLINNTQELIKPRIKSNTSGMEYVFNSKTDNYLVYKAKNIKTDEALKLYIENQSISANANDKISIKLEYKTNSSTNFRFKFYNGENIIADNDILKNDEESKNNIFVFDVKTQNTISKIEIYPYGLENNNTISDFMISSFLCERKNSSGTVEETDTIKMAFPTPNVIYLNLLNYCLEKSELDQDLVNAWNNESDDMLATKLIEEGVWRNTIPGLDCATTVYYATSKYIPYKDMEHLTDMIWNRKKTRLLGNLEIEGTAATTQSINDRLIEQYEEKIENNSLSNEEETIMNTAKDILNSRLKSNSVIMNYIKQNNGDYLVYRYPSAGNPLSLYNTKEIDLNTKKEIKIVLQYHMYSESERIKTPKVYIGENKEEVTTATFTEEEIGSYSNSSGEVKVIKATISFTPKKNEKINKIEIMPLVNRVRLYNIRISNGNDVVWQFGVNEVLAYTEITEYMTKTDGYYTVNDDYVKFINGITESENYLNECVRNIMSKQQFYKGYKELKCGDVIASYFIRQGHIRMITGNVNIVEKNGFIDPINSYVVATDIAGGFANSSEYNKNNYGQEVTYGSSVNDGKVVNGEALIFANPNPEYTDANQDFSNLQGKNLNYYINRKLSFVNLISEYYVPIRINELDTGIREKAYAKVLNENTIDNICEGLKGTIYTNYNIISINFSIKDNKTGKEYTYIDYLNHSEDIKNEKMNNAYTYSLYYHTPEIVKNELKNVIESYDDFSIKIDVQSGDTLVENVVNIDSSEAESYLIETSNEYETTSTFLGIPNIKRESINSITIYKKDDINLNNVLNEKYNVDKNNLGKIVAWYDENGEGINKTYDIYIYPTRDNKVKLNPNSSFLFAHIGYNNLCTDEQIIHGLENLDTSEVTNMNHMFYNIGYHTMKNLDVSVLDTSNVENMSYMFAYPVSNIGAKSYIEHITFGGVFKTEKVTNMKSMFEGFGWNKLKELDISSFNTKNVTNMSNMFYGCGYEKMEQLNLGNNFDTSNVTTMVRMFRGTGKVSMTKLKLGDKFNTNKVVDMTEMFMNCGRDKMEILDLGEAFNKIANTNTNIFKNCGADNCLINVSSEIYLNENECKLSKNSEDKVISESERNVKFHTGKIVIGIAIKEGTMPETNILGQELDLSNAKIEVTYETGEPQDISITKAMLGNSFNKDQLGAQTVTVTYEGQTATFIVTVEEEKLEIKIEEMDEAESDGVTYLSTIDQKMTEEELRAKITTNGEVTIEAKGPKGEIGTGSTIKVSKNGKDKNYVIVIIGDLTGDGQMDDIDLLKMARYGVGLDKNLTGAYLMASNIVKDENYADDIDLLKMARILVRLDSL